MTNKYVMLNNVEHKNTKVITTHAAKYGDDVNFVPVFPLEFRRAQPFYPILFHKDPSSGQFRPVAMFGFEQRENLYLGDDGWDAPYVPLMIRRQPFLIGFQKQEGDDEKHRVVSFDMASPRISESEGEALFLEHGGMSDYLVSITEMLEMIHLATGMCDGFVAALLELDLIEAVTMDIELKDGSKNELIGFYTINEEKVQALDGETLGRLHSNNYLESIFMMMASMSSVRHLIDRKNATLSASS